jgi:hypothetical protein
MHENKVIQVIAIDEENCGYLEFPESEPIGQTYIASIGLQGQYLQTSYVDSFRDTYAGIGWTYDSDLDIFVAPTNEEITE